MICPKCGRPVTEAAVICPGCDFILDTGFLGEEILDEEKTLRPGAGGVDPAAFNLADAVILGDIDDTAQSFETSDSGFHVRESTGARLYVSGRSQALLAPDAIPAIIQAASAGVRLTPFERHVLTFIDGTRPVETIRQIAGLDEAEVKTALATLADKGVVEVVGRALVELGERASPDLPRRPQNRGLLRRQIAGAFGPVDDEADQALDEAFRTQTGLSPLNADELAPSDDDDDDVFSNEGSASNEGSGEDDVPTSATNELRSLASSSTPVGAPVDRAARTASFTPLSHTADPPALSRSSDDGFDDFGGASAFGATRRVNLSSTPSSSDASGISVELGSPTGANERGAPSTSATDALPTSTPAVGIARRASSGFDVDIDAASEERASGEASRDDIEELGELDDDDDLDMPGMGSTAIARLANSAIGFPVARRGGGRDARTVAKARLDERSRQLLSEAVDKSGSSDPLASLAEAPELPSEPRPPFLSSSASGIEASGEADDFSGDEYSEEGEPPPALRRPPTMIGSQSRGATDSLLSALSEVPDDDDDALVRAPAPSQGKPASAVFAGAPLHGMQEENGAAERRAIAARVATLASLDLRSEKDPSDLLGSSLMRSAAEVALDPPALASDVDTGPVAPHVTPAGATSASLVIDDADGAGSDQSDDDAPTAIRPQESLVRDSAGKEADARASKDNAAAFRQAAPADDDARTALTPIPTRKPKPPAKDEESSIEPSLDDLLSDEGPATPRARPSAQLAGEAAEPKAGRPSPNRASPNLPSTNRASTNRADRDPRADSLVSKSPALEISDDDDDPALSGLIEGMADLSVLRMRHDASREAFASPPLPREPSSDMGPDTLGVRSDVFTSSPNDRPGAPSDPSSSTTGNVERAAPSDDESGRTMLLRPMASERAARRIVDGDGRDDGVGRRAMRIGAADSAEHTALRDVPIRASDDEVEPGSARRPSVISSARALALDGGEPADDGERTIGAREAPRPHDSEAGDIDDAEPYADDVRTDAVEAMRKVSPISPSDESMPSPRAELSSVLDDESGLSSLASDDLASSDEGQGFEGSGEQSGETEAGGRDSPYRKDDARRALSSSVELISDDVVVRGRRVDPSSIVQATGARALDDDVASDVSEPELSELDSDADGYAGSSVDASDVGGDESNASFEGPTGNYMSDGGVAESSVSEYPLPSSLVEGAPSLERSDVDPDATAYVPHPASALLSERSDVEARRDPRAGEVSGWSGEGTANVESFTRGESTGIETRGESLQGKRRAKNGAEEDRRVVATSSEESGDPRVAGRPSPTRAGARGRGTSGGEDLREKARRHFEQALRDQREGRESRARMNAKLASVYDPHNEEYRAAVAQWGGESRRPSTDSSDKPREVQLYEEAQRLEAEDEIDGAIVLLREGIGINPLIAAFHNRLGVILAVRKHEYAEAAASVRRAVELEPDNLHYKSNYGKIVSKAKMKGQLAGPP